MKLQNKCKYKYDIIKIQGPMISVTQKKMME